MGMLEDILKEIQTLRTTVEQMKVDVASIKEALFLATGAALPASEAGSSDKQALTIPTDSKQANLFFRIAQLYHRERERKALENNERMSTHLLSKQTAAEIAAFLFEILSPHVPGLKVLAENPYIIIRVAEKPVTLIRYTNDLGFYRPDKKFHDQLKKKVGPKAGAVGADATRVHVLVGTVRNSLDQTHVKTVLGQNAPSVGDLLLPQYRPTLERYLEAVRNGLPREVVAVPRNLHFLSADRHLNDTDLWDEAGNPLLHADWFFPDLEEMIAALIADYAN